jgi:hypothetical protein
LFEGSKAISAGLLPTFTVATTVLVVALITETVSEPELATYTLLRPVLIGVTVTLIVVGVVAAPRGEPVTWKLCGPGATEDATLIVNSLVAPDEEGVTGLTVKELHVIPAGRLLLTHDKVTG